MKFYFCESCGKRITDTDIDAGKGRDKKLKGIYCSECSKGVMTMEMLPLSEDQARKILNKPPESKAGESKNQGVPPKRGTSSTGIPAASPRDEITARVVVLKAVPKPTSSAVTVGIVVGLMAAVVLVLTVLSSNTKSSSTGPAPALPPPVFAPPSMPPAKVSRTGNKMPEHVLAQKEAGAASDDPARAAFEKLERFEGLQANDTPGKIAVVEAFLQEYGESLLAPRARLLLNDLKGAEKTDASKSAAEFKTDPGETQTATDTKLGVNPPRKEGSGFMWEIFEGLKFEKPVFKSVERNLAFSWPSGVPKGVDGKGGVSCRYTGYIEPPETGSYVFEAQARGKCTLSLNGVVVFVNYFGHDKDKESLPINLEAGKKYLFTACFSNKDGPSEFNAAWRKADGKSMSLEAMPPETQDKPPAVSDWNGGWKMEYGKTGADEVLFTRNEVSIDWNYETGAPGPGPVDAFWVHWTGLVTPPKTAPYTFIIDADEGARIFVNDIMLIDTSCGQHGRFETDPIQLEECKSYLVRVEHHDWDWVAHCRLLWSSAEMPEQLVRVSAPQAAPTGELPPMGFLAEYWNDAAAKPQVTRFERRAGTNWSTGSPDPSLKQDYFNSRYTGWITPPADGDYTFSVKYDSGARLSIDDVVLLDWLHCGGSKTDTTTIRLLGGKWYFVKLEHRELDWVSYLEFKWKSAEMSERYVLGMQPGAHKAKDKDYGRVDGGLLTEYTSGKVSVKRLEATLWNNFGPGGSPDPSIPKDGWNGKWTGGMKIEVSGNYVFKLFASNLGEMKLNKSVLIKGSDKGVESAPTPLQKGGIYPVEFTLSDRNWVSSIQLFWKLPGKTEFEPVPPGTFVFPPEASSYIKKVP